jgi:hypothetical protein
MSLATQTPLTCICCTQSAAAGTFVYVDQDPRLGLKENALHYCAVLWSSLNIEYSQFTHITKFQLAFGLMQLKNLISGPHLSPNAQQLYNEEVASLTGDDGVLSRTNDALLAKYLHDAAPLE